MSKKASVAIVRKAEQRKVLPYTVIELGTDPVVARRAKYEFQLQAATNLSQSNSNKRFKAINKYLEDRTPFECPNKPWTVDYSGCLRPPSELHHDWVTTRKYLIFKETKCSLCGRLADKKDSK